jgi:hypothetical protein
MNVFLEKNAMKRRRFLALVVAGLAAAAYPVWRCLVPPHRIDRTRRAQIRPGMTQPEVEAMLGVPPGDYSSGEHRASVYLAPDSFPPGGTRCENWQTADTAFAVCFNKDAKVLSVYKVRGTG